MTLPRFLSSASTAAAALVILATASPSAAYERRFSFSYETYTQPAGQWEYEQWFTWKHYDDKDRFDFRHEFEYGITDSLMIGIYVFDWRYEDTDGGSEAEWKKSGLEMIYQLSDPTKSPIGAALYGEVLAGPEELELEGKLLLQKNLGPVTMVYNLVVEAEWEGDDLGSLDESVGVWENTFGVDYQISPSFYIGMEALHEVEFEEWQDAGDHVVYVGPNLSFRAGSFFATIAGLFQATDVEGEADSQLRVLAGFHF